MDGSIQENRRYARAGRSLQLRYRDFKNAGAVPLGSLTTDVSEGGVAFDSDKFLRLESRFVMEVSLPEVSGTVKAISKVAWIKRLAGANGYRVGINFVWMSRGDKERLAGV